MTGYLLVALACYAGVVGYLIAGLCVLAGALMIAEVIPSPAVAGIIVLGWPVVLGVLVGAACLMLPVVLVIDWLS